MNSYITKIKVNYSINKEIVESFNKLTKEKAINKSRLIEIFIDDWIKKNKISNV